MRVRNFEHSNLLHSRSIELEPFIESASTSESQEIIDSFAADLRERFPSCPESEILAIARHACAPASGRVGTSTTAEDPIRAAVVAYIRHQHTDYDDQLAVKRNRQSARDLILPVIHETLRKWQTVPGARELDF